MDDKFYFINLPPKTKRALEDILNVSVTNIIKFILVNGIQSYARKRHQAGTLAYWKTILEYTGSLTNEIEAELIAHTFGINDEK